MGFDRRSWFLWEMSLVVLAVSRGSTRFDMDFALGFTTGGRIARDR